LDCVKIAYEWGKLHFEEHNKLRLFAAVVKVRLVEPEGVGARIILKWDLEMNCKCLNCV